MAYLAALLSGMVFYVFYREWFSWVALMTLLLLPLLSLAVSLPAMKTVQVHLACPEKVRVGLPAKTTLETTCKFPAPPICSRIRLHNVLTDSRYIGQPGERIPTDRCGMLTVSYDRLYVCDYLGLFRRRLEQKGQHRIFVFPKPVLTDRLPTFLGAQVGSWRPKPGGGFSDEHELRLYRPGDDLRQIHWKMSAKTKKLIYREPMESVQQKCVITVTLSGKGRQLDRKVGQLLWLSGRLVEQNVFHQVRCITAQGEVSFSVRDRAQLEAGMKQILGSTPLKKGQDQDGVSCLVGGQSHEA